MRPVIEKLIQKKKFRQDTDVVDFFISLGAFTNGKFKIHVLTQGLNKAFNLYF